MKTSDIVPVTVNLHLTPACNYACGFCYAIFAKLRAARGPEEWIQVIRLLAEAPPLFGRYKIDKLTFAGGEPTLVPYLPELLRAAKEAGFVTCLVTNGTRLSDALLALCAPYLDWVALSIESGNEATNAKLGRGTGRHVATIRAAVSQLRRYRHIRLKVNTVVTSLNWEEDLHDLLRELRPDRWKVLQATRIEDQNGDVIGSYEITPEQFGDFCRRHADLSPICETEDDIKGSYLMIDPERRFCGNSQGHYVFSAPVLDIGVGEAVRQVGWSPEAFIGRGGSYDWRNAGTKGSTDAPQVLATRDGLPPSIAIEGLDGSGKSTVARLLARRIGATLVKNPPDSLSAARVAADASPEDERRAWYANANRVADEEAAHHQREGRVVVMDRCVASTLAFGSAHTGAVARPEDWPSDIRRPDAIFLLTVAESVRLERLGSRPTTETEEEARLRTDDCFRERVLSGYAALGAIAVPAKGTPDEIVDRIVRLLETNS